MDIFDGDNTRAGGGEGGEGCRRGDEGDGKIVMIAVASIDGGYKVSESYANF